MPRTKDLKLDMALEGFLDYLIVERGLANLTIQSYKCDLMGFFNFLDERGKQNTTDIAREDIFSYLEIL
jgi:site-specific recombinase XerD